MISPQMALSDLIKASNSSGVLVRGTAAPWITDARTAGSLLAFTTAA